MMGTVRLDDVMLAVLGVLAWVGLSLSCPTPASAQALVWTQRHASGPWPESTDSMAYDEARGVVVLIKYDPTSANVQVHEWNGVTWAHRNATGPTRRYRPAVAFDAGRRVVVLFGGLTGNTRDGQTWEWNGINWTPRVVSGPSPRSDASMVYDSARRVIVLFGGFTGAGPGAPNSETWEWDGTTWTQRAVTNPPPRAVAAMTYDVARGKTVLFGGSNLFTFRSDTWEWDGTTWTQRSSTGPTRRYAHAMAYDPRRGASVLFGGVAYDGVAGEMRDNGETWEWNGSSWTQLALSGPEPRSHHAMAYSPHGAVLVFGGDDQSGSAFVDTWTMDTRCAADLDNDGLRANGGTRDWAVTIDDLLFYLSEFEVEAQNADLDNGTFTGTRDGLVTIDDLLFFLVRFEEGC